jgi:hypothetical protein
MPTRNPFTRIWACVALCHRDVFRLRDGRHVEPVALCDDPE